MAAALAVAMTVAAGCGGSSSSSSTAIGGTTPTAVLTQASAAAKKQSSVGFDVTFKLQLHGTLKSAGAASMFLTGPISLALKGHSTSAAAPGPTKADFQFAINFTGGSASGEVRAPGGKTAYISAPALLGPGWHSFPLSSTSIAGSGTGTLSGVDPAKWLGNLSVTSTSSTDTVSGELQMQKVLAGVMPLTGSTMTRAQRAQLSMIAAAFKTAQGSVSVDRSTHLPSAFQATLKLVFGRAMAAQADGLKGLDLNATAHFYDWGKRFTVTAPAGATPLPGGGLGMLSQSSSSAT
ncbi:MAG: hypothetical protein ACTHNU_10195 [Gaiellales bacterium]